MFESNAAAITRGQLIDLLNEDLSREVLSISGYAKSSRELSDSSNAALASCFKAYAEAEFAHAMSIVAQIDTLGGEPILAQAPEGASFRADNLLRADLDHEAAAISRYQVRVCQCEMLGEHAVADSIRQILAQKLDQLARLLTALDAPTAQRSDRLHTLTASL